MILNVFYLICHLSSFFKTLSSHLSILSPPLAPQASGTSTKQGSRCLRAMTFYRNFAALSPRSCLLTVSLGQLRLAHLVDQSDRLSFLR